MNSTRVKVLQYESHQVLQASTSLQLVLTRVSSTYLNRCLGAVPVQVIL